MRDFVEFDSYGRVRIPVKEGERKGEVRSFLHTSRSPEQIGSYVLGLQELIEKQKYVDSIIASEDIGPAKAVANAMEHGNHQRFLEEILARSGLVLSGVEKTLEVQEGDDIYHILPRDSSMSLKLVEQRGLFIFHLYDQFQKSGVLDKTEAYQWLHNNCDQFREIMGKCKEDAAHRGFSKYQSCSVLMNLCKRTLEELRLSPDAIEKADIGLAIKRYASVETRSPAYATA